jgi:hypothetical protein
MVKAKQEVAVVEEDEEYQLPAEMLDEMIADAGAGLSTSADDNIVPFIVLLQDMSPEVKKRDPNYVEGAEAGMYMNKASKQLYAGDRSMAERTGLPQLEFQHCILDKCVVEWIPRLDGGGFIARHQDPNKTIWKNADGSHDLIETRYHFGNIVNDGNPRPAVLAFSSTGHTTSRQWMTTMNEFKINDPKTGQVMRNAQGEPLTLPAWARKYIVGTKARENKKGSFFVGTVEDGGFIRDANIRSTGKKLHDAVKSGLVTAAADDAGGGGGVSNEI